ncbi:MAG: SCP2 sterol-binding domain-containing protein [archaeon]|nr:SCP2 sterol-binding domain-containing protein [archaeon]
MLVFPSKEWVDSFVEKLNSSPEFAEAGENWVGDILFVVDKDENFPRTSCVYLDLFEGKCRRFEYHDDCAESKMPKSEFKYIGPYKNWVRLINKEIDPIQGIITGRFKLDGPIMKIITYRKAAKEIVNVAATIESDIQKEKKTTTI